MADRLTKMELAVALKGLAYAEASATDDSLQTTADELGITHEQAQEHLSSAQRKLRAQLARRGPR